MTYPPPPTWDRLVNWFCLLLCSLMPWRARVIPRADEPSRLLLRQFLVCHWGKLSIYLQHFEGPEAWEWFHKHRWDYMRSFVLSGRYVEERAEDVWDEDEILGFRTVHNHYQRRRFNSHRLYPESIHRVEWWDPLCWTMFVTYNPRHEWGYYPRGKYSSEDFVPWRDFIKSRVPSLETGKIE